MIDRTSPRHLRVVLALTLAACGSGGQAVRDTAPEQPAQVQEGTGETILATAEPPVVPEIEPPSVPVADPNDPTEPLSADLVAAFTAMRPDPEPDALVLDSHYWVSNENAHWVFRRAIDGLGGAFLGVGVDQVYLLAAWARSSIVIPLDFDQQVVNIHYVYGVILEHVDSPEAFVSLWSEESEPLVADLIRAEPSLAGREEAIVDSLLRGRAAVYRRLRRLVRQYDELEIPIFLTDTNQYAFVRSLWQLDRVFPIRGDLTGDRSMLDVADVLAHARVPMRVLYLSNCEVYFDYGGGFRRNIIEMPFDERSVVLRTRHLEIWGNPEGDPDYHYNIQSGFDFVRWMRDDDVANMGQMLRSHDDTDVVGLSRLGEPPIDDDDDIPFVAPRPAE